MSTVRTPTDVMRLYLEEVVARGRIELLDEIAAEDMVDQTAVAAGWGYGRQGLVKHVRTALGSLAQLKVTVERVIASHDEVVGVWRARATHAGPMFGIPATGKWIEWTNASIFRVRDGRIIDYDGVWGSLEAVAKMGVPIELPRAER
jgi:predicted ester cyclase